LAGPRRVALLIETSKSFGRGVLRGIDRYIREHGPWSIFLEPRALGSSPPRWLATWKGDGIIARISDPKIARAVRRSGRPVVNLSSSLPELRFPCIETNPRTQAQLAFAHLLERGFRDFGFVADERHHPRWSRKVGERFAELVRAAGHRFHEIELRRGGRGGRPPSWESEQRALGRWVSGLPKPVGVLTINDPVGQQFLDACRRVSAPVPERVAVIGIENDELICAMCDPPLSSVAQNPEKAGYEAAALLDRLMAGGAPPKEILTVEPLGVVTRQSTDVQAHADPVVAQAVRAIREGACRGIQVDRIARDLGVSRSTLDRRFAAALGRSPHDEITRIQLQRAMDLLANTSLKTLAVAESAGFKHPEYMGAVFRRKLGMTPGEYRKNAQRHAPPRAPAE
jgi:LacI family transcriptional regulator